MTQQEAMAVNKKYAREADNFERKHHALFKHFKDKYPDWSDHWIYSSCFTTMWQYKNEGKWLRTFFPDVCKIIDKVEKR